MQKRCRGFTLIEMLVVITIISILMALLMPAIGGAIRRAQETEASSLANDVKSALTAYNTEYGVWPYDGGAAGGTGPSNTTLSTTNAYTLLIGDPTQALAGTTYSNPRQTVYMRFQLKNLDNPEHPTKFIAPRAWKLGSAPEDYHIAVDGNYCNQLEGIPDCNSPNGKGTIILNAGCAIWCTGPPKKGKENTDTREFIRTW